MNFLAAMLPILKRLALCCLVAAVATLAATASADDPHALTVPNVVQSLHDNANFDTDASLDGHVAINPDNGRVTLFVRADPDKVITVTRTAAATELVALKAIRGWYPDATAVETDVMAHLGDGDRIAATILVSMDTANSWDLDALRESTPNDPESLFCLADHYGMTDEVWALTGHWDVCLNGQAYR